MIIAINTQEKKYVTIDCVCFSLSSHTCYDVIPFILQTTMERFYSMQYARKKYVENISTSESE